jgi:hypothetical protein
MKKGDDITIMLTLVIFTTVMSFVIAFLKFKIRSRK